MSKTALMGSIVLACVLAVIVRAPAQTANPDGANDAAASTDIMGTWARSDQEARFQPPPSGAGPVRDDPAHPHQIGRAHV